MEHLSQSQTEIGSGIIHDFSQDTSISSIQSTQENQGLKIFDFHFQKRKLVLKVQILKKNLMN